jgi:hypothetical protein
VDPTYRTTDSLLPLLLQFHTIIFTPSGFTLSTKTSMYSVQLKTIVLFNEQQGFGHNDVYVDSILPFVIFPTDLISADRALVTCIAVSSHSVEWFLAGHPGVRKLEAPTVHKIIGDHQCGFRRNRQIDQVFDTHSTLNKEWKWNRAAPQPEYSQTSRKLLTQELTYCTPPRKLFTLIKICFNNNANTRVLICKYMSHIFFADKVVKRVKTLSFP